MFLKEQQQVKSIIEKLLTFAACVLCFLPASPQALQAQDVGDSLLVAIGCGNCHDGIAKNDDLRSKAPDLTFAGEKYNPAYLFSFLQQPEPVRFYLEHERMPDFRFSEQEALAVAMFLSQQISLPENAAQIETISELLQESNAVISTEARTLIHESTCLQCHKLDGQGETKALELAKIGYRLNLDWAQKYIVSPQVFGVPETRMPSPLFLYDAASDSYQPAVQFAGAKLKKIAAYLFERGADERNTLQQQFERAKVDYPDISAADGQKIFLSQNCIACHRFAPLQPVWDKNAPDLSGEGIRVQREWLSQYLLQIKTLRPLGFYPGSGSRMPDFRLTSAEVSDLTEALMNKTKRPAKPHAIEARKLSVFSMNKARALLESRLSCLGCHRLGEKGGIIGPDLSGLKARLQPEFVFQIIDQPRATVPHTIMPRIAMPAKTRELIANYLVQQDVPAQPVAQPSLTDSPPFFAQQQSGVVALYQQNCAICHGLDGKGDGVNAAFMPTAPTNHADTNYMSGRVDDTLFDGIYVGGLILGKSHLMPGFGEMLSRQQIWDLVAYMRQLCECRQPDWAADNQ